MEKLQGPITPYLIEEDLDVGWLEEFVSNFGNNYKFEDSYNNEGSLPNLEDEMPFLQMLQEVENGGSSTSFQQMQLQEPNYFQLLLKLQHQKMSLMENHHNINYDVENPAKLESSNLNIDLHYPVKPETGLEEEHVHVQNSPKGETPLANAGSKERRKRKRPSKSNKNKEEVENQRMSHIAVERNRRKQMNDHLNALRSLMPPSYVQRGDQASIIGGAIDFVKEMEQMLQTLQAEKTMRQLEENNGNASAASSSTSSSLVTSPTSTFQFSNFDEGYNGNSTQVRRNNSNEEFTAENRSALADIKVVVIQNHVNLKIQCQRRHGQLLKVVSGFEELGLTILHLNITSLHTLVHYSFSLKIEDYCKLGSADEVVKAVHHIFSLINLG
ncbi:transcription factor bHLH57-like [Silene latifolia]|uniref:transcription factor bHLH57-like n=1 Tax=Silene latifolia TaxID=37657 RepID=UPI003D78843C